jgi:predicted dehydrogenase
MNRSRTVKVGLVGCGEVTRFKHLVVLRGLPGIEVAAVADRDEDQLRSVADQFHIAHRYRDVSALLEHSELDAVAVCVPAHSHADVAIAVMEAGKHLLVEKPLCLSLDDADRLRDRAAGSNLRIMVGHHMRWHRLIRKGREVIRNGVLGAIESIRTVWNSPRINRENPEWRFRRERGGGVLVEVAVHCFDLWRFLLESEVAEVYAVSRAGQRDDEAIAVIARMENGMIATGLLSETAPHEIEVEVCGDGGRMRLDCGRFDGFELLPAGTAPTEPGPRLRRMYNFCLELPRGLVGMRAGSDYLASYRAEWLHFRDAIRSGANPDCTLEDGRRSLEIVLAAAESTTRGVPVRIRDAPRELVAANR